MSRQLFVNIGNFTASTSFADAIAGNATPVVNVFDVDNIAGGSLDLTEPCEAKRIQIVQRPKPNEAPVLSGIINLSDVKETVSKAYVAPVAQVTTVTTATGTGEAVIRVVNLRDYKPHPRITASVMLDGKTKAQITDAFVKALNKQFPKFVTASKDGSDNLVLTGNIGVSFMTATELNASGFTITATATPNLGSGTAEHLKKLESESQGLGENFTNRIYLPITPPSYVDPALTYDMHKILVKTTTTPNISKGHQYLEVTIAAAAGNTGIDLPVFFGFEEPSGT